jgi:hypothetical protein
MTRALELGMDCLEHIRVTGRELLPPDDADRIDPLPLGTRETLLWERFDPQSPGMERLIARLADDRIFLDPTLLVDLATFDRVPDDPAAEAVIEAFPETMRSELRQSRWMADLRPPEELAERARAGLAKRFDFIGRCNDAGVRLLAGTDTFGPGALLPGASLINELELLQQAGLSPLQVLQAATITAAAALGQEDDLGTLEEGKLADVVVLDADPLVDIRHVREIRLTVRGGQTCTPQRLIAEVSTGEESKS